MLYDRDKHKRHSTRLKQYDYYRSGAYFITICTQNIICLMGDINNGEMILSESGIIVHKCWEELNVNFNNVETDEFIIMPSHIHCIIFLHDIPLSEDRCRGLIYQTHCNKFEDKTSAIQFDDSKNLPWILMKSKKHVLGKIIRYFKAKSSKLIHDIDIWDFKWQRNYYDHIIRSEKELNRIRQYIIENPLKWEFDRENKQSVNYNMVYEEYFHDIYL